MKRFQTIAVFASLSIIGVASAKSDEPVKIAGKAYVRRVIGKANYSVGGVTKRLRPNMELDAGTTVTTGRESTVFVNVNGLSSTICLDADTTLIITTMDRVGSGLNVETHTMLNLKMGSIPGEVKKVSGNSSYEIQTLNGVAQVRGTDFEISAVKRPIGGFSTTFNCVCGSVVVSAFVEGVMRTNELGSGQAWIPGEGGPHPIPTQKLDEYEARFFAIADENFTALPLPHQITILPVFPTGGPPMQGGFIGANKSVPAAPQPMAVDPAGHR